MKIVCSTCSTKYSISDEKLRGKTSKLRCKKCSSTIVIQWDETQQEPSVSSTPAPSAAPAPPSVDAKEQTTPLKPSPADAVQEAMRLYESRQHEERRQKVRSWLLPDESWLTRQLDPEVAAAYWRFYQSNQEALYRELEDLTTASPVEPMQLRAEEVTSLETEGASEAQALLLASMRHKEPLYTLVLSVGERSIKLRSWIFWEGGWRYLGEPLLLLTHPNTEAAVRSLQKGAPTTPGAFAATFEGLQAQMALLTKTIKAKDWLGIRALLEQCRLREPSAFFPKHFGARGASMAARYQQLWADASAFLFQIVSLVCSSGESTEIEGGVMESPAEIYESFYLKHLPPPKVPLGFFTMQAVPFGYWFYEEGAWRYTLFLPALVSFPETPQGLLDFVLTLRFLSNGKLPIERLSLSRLLMLPSPKDWFVAHFGEEPGKPLVEEYQSFLDEDVSLELGRHLAQTRPEQISTDGQLSPYSRELTGLQRHALFCMKEPVPLYRVDVGGYVFWSFVYVGGHWRFLGKMRASDSLEAPPKRLRPQPQSFETNGKGLEAFLTSWSYYLDQEANAKESTRESLQALLNELSQSLLLPDPAAFFAKGFAPELAKPLTEEYLTNVTPSLIASFFEMLLIAGGLKVKEDQTSPFYRRFLLAHYQKETPLFWTVHQGAGSQAPMGAWAYVDGGWRFVGPMKAIFSLEAWKKELGYSERFSENEEGLQALFAAMLQSASEDPVLFAFFFELLRPKEAPLSWFAGFDEITPEKAKAEYEKRYEEGSKELWARMIAVQHPEDIWLTAQASETPPDYILLWEDVRRQTAWGLGPLRFCHGAWRSLGGFFRAD